MPTATPALKSPAKPARKPRARKASTAAKRTRKAAPTKVNPTSATPLPVVITPDAPSVKKAYAKIELKSLKDYPRDGLSLILLPVFYLEAFVKELLPLIGQIKTPSNIRSYTKVG
jgi:hypothetical protein